VLKSSYLFSILARTVGIFFPQGFNAPSQPRRRVSLSLFLLRLNFATIPRLSLLFVRIRSPLSHTRYSAPWRPSTLSLRPTQLEDSPAFTSSAFGRGGVRVILASGRPVTEAGLITGIGSISPMRGLAVAWSPSMTVTTVAGCAWVWSCLHGRCGYNSRGERTQTRIE